METKYRLRLLEEIVENDKRCARERDRDLQHMFIDHIESETKTIRQLAREEAQKVLAEGPLRWLYEPRLVGPLSREEADRLREEDSAKRKLAKLQKWVAGELDEADRKYNEPSQQVRDFWLGRWGALEDAKDFIKDA